MGCAAAAHQGAVPESPTPRTDVESAERTPRRYEYKRQNTDKFSCPGLCISSLSVGRSAQSPSPSPSPPPQRTSLPPAIPLPYPKPAVRPRHSSLGEIPPSTHGVHCFIENCLVIERGRSQSVAGHSAACPNPSPHSRVTSPTATERPDSPRVSQRSGKTVEPGRTPATSLPATVRATSPMVAQRNVHLEAITSPTLTRSAEAPPVSQLSLEAAETEPSNHDAERLCRADAVGNAPPRGPFTSEGTDSSSVAPPQSEARSDCDVVPAEYAEEPPSRSVPSAMRTSNNKPLLAPMLRATAEVHAKLELVARLADEASQEAARSPPPSVPRHPTQAGARQAVGGQEAPQPSRGEAPVDTGRPTSSVNGQLTQISIRDMARLAGQDEHQTVRKPGRTRPRKPKHYCLTFDYDERDPRGKHMDSMGPVMFEGFLQNFIEDHVSHLVRKNGVFF